MKKPIRLVISNGEYHATKKSLQERRDEGLQHCSSNTLSNKTSNNSPPSHSTTPSSNTRHISNNDKNYFGSPLPMYGGRFLGSPMYTIPLTPPLDENCSEEVMQVDESNEENAHSPPVVKSPSATHHNNDIFTFQYGKGSLESKQMSVDDYLSASSSDDGEDEEVCQLMFRSTVANDADCLKSVSSSNNNSTNNNNGCNNTHNNTRHGPDTRSKTNSLRSSEDLRCRNF